MQWEAQGLVFNVRQQPRPGTELKKVSTCTLLYQKFWLADRPLVHRTL